MTDPIITRKYTLAEIDRMRYVIESCAFGAGAYRGGERQREVEDRLRTYMMAGVSLEDLETQYQIKVNF